MNAAYVSWSACLHGISPADVRLSDDAGHGALYLYLTREVSVRIQVTPTAYEDADEHAAGLERDLAGLRQLADTAARAARVIERRLHGGEA